MSNSTLINKEYTYLNCKRYFTRLDIEWQDDSVKYISNHYLIGGKLFFTFEQKFDLNSESKSSVDENRYYFFHSELIRIIKGKDKKIIRYLDMRRQEESFIELRDSIERINEKFRKSRDL